MASKKKQTDHSFTSLRIIGGRAQKWLARAREMKRARPKPEEEDASGDERPGGAVEVTVELSLGSVVRSALSVIAIGLGVLMLYMLLDKIVLLILAIFVAVVIDPGVEALKRWGVPRGFGVLLHYFVALFLLIFLLVSLVPVMAEQIQQIAAFMSEQVNLFLADPHISLPFLTADVNMRLTYVIQSTLQTLSINQFTDAMQQLGQNMATTAQGSLQVAAQVAGSVLDFVLNLILILVLAFFLQLEKRKVIAWLRSFLPWSFRPYVDDKSEAIQWKLAEWARGQLLLCLSVMVMVLLALTILRMPYALTLAILSGFTEFIPVIGPLLAAIPAILIGITQQGFFWGLVIISVYYVIQWCENNLLVPLIMKRTVGLSPITILFSMLVGISFPSVIHPVIGLILSIPLATILSLFLEDWRAYRLRRTLKGTPPAASAGTD